MAKIHWLIYIIVGLFVSIASWKLNYEKLIFFFYAGWIFVFVGVVKLIINFVKSKETKPKVMHHKPHHQARFRYCQKCANILRPHDKFCSICGAKV